MRLIPGAVLTTGILTLSQASVQQSSDQPAFRVTTNRVIVEFIAVDKKSGRFVLDLDKDELQLSVDKKRQRLDLLVAPRSLSGATPGEETAVLQHPAGTSARRTVILLDSRAIDAGNFTYAVNAIRRFVSESLRADHLVMIAEIDRVLNTLSPFTRDKAVLLDSLGKLRPATASNPLDRSRNKSSDTDYLDELQQQVTYLRKGLTLLCYSLSAIPGSKHIVFFSEGYALDPVTDIEFEAREQVAFSKNNTVRQVRSRQAGSVRDPGVLPMIQDVVGLANNFGINFYTVDARGLSAVPGLSSEVSGRPSETDFPVLGDAPPQVLNASGLTAFNLSTLTTLESARNALVALAGGTNGAAFFNSNDLGAVLRASAQEQRMVYLAAFEPRGLKKQNKGQFRRLRLKTSRPDVLLRTQVGYLDLPFEQVSSARLTAAFSRPEIFRHLIPIIDIEAQAGSTHVVFGLPGSQITPFPVGDKQRIDVAFLGRLYDQKGRPVSKDFEIARAFQVDLAAEKFTQISQEEVLGSQQLNLPAGRYKLVLAAEDRVAGTLGMGIREFEVP